MKLNEVFSPLIESNYVAIKETEPYKEIIQDYFEKERFLYRGMIDSGDLILGDTTGMRRISSGGIQFINVLVDDILPEWSKFPKRKQSFICTNDFDYAKGFGTVYHVIPLNNAMLAVAPEEDFWGCFTLYRDLAPVIAASYYLFCELLPNEKINKNPSPEEFKRYMAAVDNASSFRTKGDNVKSEVLFSKIKQYPDCMAFYRDLLNPSKFELTTELPLNAGSKEVWFSGKCLFVKYEENVDMDWIV